MKGLPLAYNKDMQEDKEPFFDAFDTVLSSVRLFKGMVRTLTFNKDRMEKSSKMGFTNATDAADYLVRKGVPFRDAHSIIGSLVLKCIREEKSLDDLSMEEWKEGSKEFNEDIYDAISLKASVERRNSLGAPGKEAMDRAIEYYREYLS